MISEIMKPKDVLQIVVSRRELGILKHGLITTIDSLDDWLIAIEDNRPDETTEKEHKEDIAELGRLLWKLTIYQNSRL